MGRAGGNGLGRGECGFVVGFVVGCVDGRIGAGGSCSSATRGENEAGSVVGVAGEKEDVGSGSVEEGCDYRREGRGAVVSEDSLVRDSSGDLEAGCSRDCPQNLVEAGVIGSDIHLPVGEGDLCGVGAGGSLRAGGAGGCDGGGQGVVTGQRGGCQRRQGLSVEAGRGQHRGEGSADRRAQQRTAQPRAYVAS